MGGVARARAGGAAVRAAAAARHQVTQQVAGEGQVYPGVAAAVQRPQQSHDHHSFVCRHTYTPSTSSHQGHHVIIKVIINVVVMVVIVVNVVIISV